ncbi:MAG TPA: hypothetical protein VK667_05235, partial [Ktedonobacteraceae bacterium]|nr:hypothetical protein [Ktedonobacteraceae bacterium]
MEDREQIRRGCLLAALEYFDPVLMELRLDQEEQANYSHKFFVIMKDGGAVIYRISPGHYAVTGRITPDDAEDEQTLSLPLDLVIQGIPLGVPQTVEALCRSRLQHAITELLQKTRLSDIKITVGTSAALLDEHSGPFPEVATASNAGPGDDPPVEVRALQYKAQPP